MSSFTFAPGTVIDGTFRIERLLKQGGMGAVYVAEQEGTGARRALKLMHAHLVRDESARARFELEARIGARVESDHVVDIVAAGVDEEEQLPYIAMELLDGVDLGARVVDGGPLSLAEAHVLFTHLGDALAAAHGAGIVHRDLKPENIFLARPKRRGEPFTVKVLDFGIARVMADARLTLTGGIGSPIWMAPEQTGNTQPITPRTDVWALGLLAFYVLTGKHFWFALHDETASPLQVLGEIARPEYDAPSARLAALGGGVALPDGFDAWFARAVVRDADARFADAATAIEALLPMLPAAPPPPVSVAPAPTRTPSVAPPASEAQPASSVVAAAPSVAASTSQATSRRRAALALVGLALLTLIAAGVVWARRGDGRGAVPARSPVAVPAASVSLGSREDADDRPRRAAVAAFAIGATEVTVAEYASCVADRACTEPGRGDGCNGGVAARGAHPINCVTYAQAEAYCRYRRQRLPTEEEFELAARGPDDRPAPWGVGDAKDRLCWGRGDTREGTCRVASFAGGATPDGVFDLAGNVSEWTSTCASPGCGDERRVARGGGWSSVDARVARASTRLSLRPTERRNDVGFRCAVTAPAGSR
ncbi:MAG: SUMF1/EgtB/PvdO family nonheme iron enzyme [Polyangiaceae bacterium]|nr:SUMF1/EgtB/PvdO family nonheme iron enzyme [Polyangiaceae bacterium]